MDGRKKHSIIGATGHIVFAAFPTSNVETTFTRLTKMGRPPAQLADSLVCVQARRGARSDDGFTLIELLVVAAIIAVLAALAVIGYPAVMRGTKESLVGGKLQEIGEAQMQYRVGLGRPRYGTLAELRAARSATGAPLVGPNLAPADAGGDPVALDGWIVREPAGAPTGDALRSAFAIEAVPAAGNPSTNSYCLHEDGVLRRAAGGGACTRASNAVQR